jgi:hypothetical protein
MFIQKNDINFNGIVHIYCFFFITTSLKKPVYHFQEKYANSSYLFV